MIHKLWLNFRKRRLKPTSKPAKTILAGWSTTNFRMELRKPFLGVRELVIFELVNPSRIWIRIKSSELEEWKGKAKTYYPMWTYQELEGIISSAQKKLGEMDQEASENQW